MVMGLLLVSQDVSASHGICVLAPAAPDPLRRGFAAPRSGKAGDSAEKQTHTRKRMAAGNVAF